MTNINIRFNEGKETQIIHIPASTNKKKIHLVFAKAEDKLSNEVDVLILNNEIYFQCKICSKNFRDKKCISSHIRKVHRKHDEQTYLCTYCGKSLSSMASFHSHMKSHKERPYQCDLCRWRFDTEEKLKLHHEGQHAGRERLYTCGNCSKTFMCMSHLKSHVLTHSSEKLYRCGECNKGFNRMSSLDVHLITHNKDWVYKCDICGKQVKHRTTFLKHLRTMHPKKKKKLQSSGAVPCSSDGNAKAVPSSSDGNAKVVPSSSDGNADGEPLCSEGNSLSKSTSNENQPKQSHNVETTVSTSEKDKTTIIADNFEGIDDDSDEDDGKEQERAIFRERQTEFPCPECGKVFKKKDFLTNHMRIHTGEKPFVCEICNKAFKQQGHLHRHRKVHTGEKNFMCSYCHKKFGRAEHVRQHEKKMHLNQGQEVVLTICNICGQSYRNLPKHMRTHETKVKCDDCGGEFKNEKMFKNHIVEGHHFIGDVRHCPICQKSFSKFAHVRRHVINLHASKSFRCSICGDGFLSAEDFQNHIVKGHSLNKKRKKKKKKVSDSDDDENNKALPLEEALDFDVLGKQQNIATRGTFG